MKLFDGTLPIRRWLALALIATFLVPVIVTIIAGAAEFGSSWHSAGQAEQTLRTGVSQWNDPAWRRATQRSLAAQGMTFVLQEGGRTIYRSSRDPFSSVGINNQLSVQRLVIPGAREQHVAYVYSRPFGPGFAGGGFLFAPLLGLIALLLTLSAIAWFLRRTLIVPLAATSRAARRIAGGDLDIALPDSRIDEVAELKTAFLVMNSELRTSLQHQAAIEEERRLFVSAIAHDLRTPLFSLRGYLEGLEQGLANTPQKMAHYIRICRDKADALE
ncbi:MAG: histidine kinase dimerization/phospho-acceptor domain-containing protein, partial [Chloroflexota bacterium]